MAKVPRVERSNPLSQLVGDAPSTGQVWHGLALAAETAAELLQPQADADAKAKGANAVYRDDTGALRVHEASPLGGRLSEIHNQAAYASYLAQSSVDHAERLQALRTEFEYDPVGFQSAANEYVNAQAEAAPDLLKGTVRSNASRQATAIFGGLQNAHAARLEKRADASTAANLEMLSQDYLDVAETAGPDSPAAMAVMDEIKGVVDYRMSAPFIGLTEPEANKYVADLRRQAAFGRLKASDPDAVNRILDENPDWVGDLTVADRRALASGARGSASQAERARIAELKAKRAETDRTAYRLWSEGKLTRDWVDQNEAFLSDGAYKAMQGYLYENPAATARTTDPDAYADLFALADTDPSEAYRQAARDYRSGKLSQEAFIKIQDRLEAAESAPADPIKEELKAEIEPTLLNEDEQKSFVMAIEDYEAQAAGLETEEERAALKDQMVRQEKMRRLKAAYETLPVPIELRRKGRHVFTLEDLEDAAVRMVEARNRGDIDQETFKARAVLFKQWKEVLENVGPVDGN